MYSNLGGHRPQELSEHLSLVHRLKSPPRTWHGTGAAMDRYTGRRIDMLRSYRNTIVGSKWLACRWVATSQNFDRIRFATGYPWHVEPQFLHLTQTVYKIISKISFQAIHPRTCIMSASSARDLWALERAIDVLEIINQAMIFAMHGFSPILGVSTQQVVAGWPYPVYHVSHAFTVFDLTPTIVCMCTVSRRCWDPW